MQQALQFGERNSLWRGKRLKRIMEPKWKKTV